MISLRLATRRLGGFLHASKAKPSFLQHGISSFSTTSSSGSSFSSSASSFLMSSSLSSSTKLMSPFSPKIMDVGVSHGSRFLSTEAAVEAEAELIGREASSLTIGVPSESFKGEKRVAATPESIAKLVKLGYNVVVAAGAGALSNISDADYEAAGAKVVASDAEALGADIVVKVRPPTADEVKSLKKGGKVLSFVFPGQHPELVESLRSQGVTSMAMDCVPRISRAQSMDALSSMSNASGYKAVVEAAHHFGRYFTGQITAAGKVPPAKVLVIGAGVAGLSAIGTAKNLGAIVRGFDTRSACKEQVESLGGQFLTVEIEEDGDGAGGYAKEMSKEFIEAEMKLFAEQCRDVDVVITTALIPGKPAPKLISREMIESMRDGSVVVDLAAEAGGNIETTKPGETYVYKGVTHIGATDFPSQLSSLSSFLYANNVATIIKEMTTSEGMHVHDMEDDVVRGASVTHEGVVTWPPPPPKVDPNAALKKEAEVKLSPEEIAAKEEAEAFERTVTIPKKEALTGALLTSGGMTAILGAGAVAPTSEFLNLISVFGLAGVCGYQTVWGVAHALHSPLMSVTNAISGMTAVGGLLVMGGGIVPTDWAQFLGFASVFASCVNIGGGFTITTRMLDMFRREGDPLNFTHYYAIPAGVLVGGYLFGSHAGFDLTQMAYLASAVCCISSIAGLASQETARLGNALGMVGVSTGIAATVGSLAGSGLDPLVYAQIGGAIAGGTAIGYRIAKDIGVTELPQLTAAFHSVVGLAAVLTSAASYIAQYDHLTADVTGSALVHKVAIFGGVLIGSVTMTGSIVAWGKLQGVMKSDALTLPGKHLINASLAAGNIGLAAAFLGDISLASGVTYLGGTTALAGLLGWHVTAAIGGADMPVAVCLLNSYSGWALVAEGFLLENHLLTVVGALIGFSGAILSKIMCDGMGRSLTNVIFGGIASATGPALGITGVHKEIDAEGTAELLFESSQVAIVPGYGLATAHAQSAVADIAKKLTDNGVAVKFVIHEIAGRLPGQLNVLLAAAGVPYDIVYERDEVNMEEVDVCVVVGSNDVVNIGARDDPNSPLAGMPIIHADKAKHVIVMKRSLGTGYAAVDNPLFYTENTHMLLGDAKASCEAVSNKISDLI